MIDWPFDLEHIERMLDQFCDDSLRLDQKLARLLVRLVPARQDLAAVWRDRLTDDCWETRDRAAHAIGELRVSDSQTISALIGCLKDQSTDVRASAAYSLGLVRLASTDEVVRALSHHLTDAEPAFYGGRHVCDDAYSSIISLLADAVSDAPLLP
jgi:HEAT repeat protein